MARPLFQLNPRLALCAGMIRGGRPFCDVGTDHAYLPVWLLKTGKISQALACDINPGPLETAAGNACRYRVTDKITLRLSDGLREVRPEEADDIVIAGMGGELILRMIAETCWLRDESKLLVLQPMSSARELRTGLRDLGFTLLREQAVEDSGRVYTAFSAVYIGHPPKTDLLYPFLGKLEPGAGPAARYAEKVLRDLRGRLEGALRGRGTDSPEELQTAIKEIEERFIRTRAEI